MKNLTEEIIKSLPKTELHVHLDGSIRIETILDIAKKENVDMGTEDPEQLKQMLSVGKIKENLNEYLCSFDITLKVMQSEEALFRIAFELAEDCAKENIRYVEVRFSPVLHQQKGAKLTKIIEAVLAGLKKAELVYNIKTGTIICGIRNISPDTSLMLAEIAIAYKNKGIVAFDLAGKEEDFPAKEHREAFFLILNNNVNCTAHAGEAYGPRSISQAIHYCGAHRIGHGTRLKEDGDLLNYVNDHRIPLEICLTSNLQTGYIKEYAQHPLKFYYDFGLRVTINTDNRLMSDTTVTRELFLAHKHFDFDFTDIKNIIIDGFKSSFLPYMEKTEMLRRVQREFGEIQDRLSKEGKLTSEIVDEKKLFLIDERPY